jgi:colanic acid biosynthesis protein WcaH
MATKLNYVDYRTAVRLAPLVSLDLIIRNHENKVLLGLRNNDPAKDYYFVPGGSILKNERLSEAFMRVILEEVHHVGNFENAKLFGVSEHFYDTNLFGDPGYGTHYVVLAYTYEITGALNIIPDQQHKEYRWWNEAALLSSDQVHENTKAYFRRYNSAESNAADPA